MSDVKWIKITTDIGRVPQVRIRLAGGEERWN